VKNITSQGLKECKHLNFFVFFFCLFIFLWCGFFFSLFFGTSLPFTFYPFVIPESAAQLKLLFYLFSARYAQLTMAKLPLEIEKRKPNFYFLPYLVVFPKEGKGKINLICNSYSHSYSRSTNRDANSRTNKLSTRIYFVGIQKHGR